MLIYGVSRVLWSCSVSLLFQHTHCSDPLSWLLHCAVTFFFLLQVSGCVRVFIAHTGLICFGHITAGICFGLLCCRWSHLWLDSLSVFCALPQVCLLWDNIFGRNRLGTWFFQRFGSKAAVCMLVIHPHRLCTYANRFN